MRNTNHDTIHLGELYAASGLLLREELIVERLISSILIPSKIESGGIEIWQNEWNKRHSTCFTMHTNTL